VHEMGKELSIFWCVRQAYFILTAQKYATGFILSASNEIFTILVYNSHINNFIQVFNWIQLSEPYGMLNYTESKHVNIDTVNKEYYILGCYTV
jgi:hypothetical protein